MTEEGLKHASFMLWNSSPEGRQYALQFGRYGKKEYLGLFDVGCDGTVDKIMDEFKGSQRRNRISDIREYLGEKEADNLSKRFEKADKIFAEYKTKLKDAIERAEKEFKEQYAAHIAELEAYGDPLDRYSG